MKTKVYTGRKGKAFKNEEELQTRIRSVWKDCAKEIPTMRKAIRQFVPRLNAINEKDGHSIKMLFGWSTLNAVIILFTFSAMRKFINLLCNVSGDWDVRYRREGKSDKLVSFRKFIFLISGDLTSIFVQEERIPFSLRPPFRSCALFNRVCNIPLGSKLLLLWVWVRVLLTSKGRVSYRRRKNHGVLYGPPGMTVQDGSELFRKFHMGQNCSNLSEVKG